MTQNQIRNLILKTTGLVDVFQFALGHNPDILTAFIFGSLARGNLKAGSDVDLMIIGKLGLRKLSKILSGIPEQIGRELNPHILSVDEFKKRKSKRDHFLMQVLANPKIFITGNKIELESMGS